MGLIFPDLGHSDIKQKLGGQNKIFKKFHASSSKSLLQLLLKKYDKPNSKHAEMAAISSDQPPSAQKFIQIQTRFQHPNGRFKPYHVG